jgi:DNA-binding transcriptional ArsR family regulator
MNSTDINYDQIPLELRERSQWVVMRLVKDIKTGKLKKVPYQCNAIKADVTEPSTWATFAEVNDAFKGGSYDGIGYVFTESDPYVGVDVDGCRDSATCIAKPWAQQIIDQLDSYTEISVSGTGFHCLVKATKPPQSKSRVDSLEIYSSGRYFVVTGEHVKGTPLTINTRQAQLESVMTEYKFAQQIPRLKTTPKSAVVNGLVFDTNARCPDDVWGLIEASEGLQGLWRADTMLDGQTDDSPSGYGFMLLGQLAMKGIVAQSLLDTLIAFRRHVNARDKSESWYRDEVANAHLRADQIRTTTRASNDTLVELTFRHLRQEPEVKPIDFCVLAVLALASRDGDTARVSVKEITAQLNVSEEHVQRHLRKLEELGCIVVVETARRHRPKLYRFALSHVPP